MKIVKMVRGKWNRFGEKRRRMIISIAKGHPDANTRRRAQIIMALVQATPVKSIVDLLHCSKTHVYNVMHRFMEHGQAAFADRREDNGTPVTNKTVERTVRTLVSGSPQSFGRRRTTWTLELLVSVLKKRTGITLSCTTMWRLLRRLKIRLGCPKPFVNCPWPKSRRDQRIQRLRYLLLHAREGDVWLFEDEVDIHLNPKIGRDYMLPGTQKKVLTPGVNKKHYLAGALNAFSGELTWVEGESKNSELFMHMLFAIGRRYREVRRIHLIIDNCSIHKSKFTKLVLSECAGKVRLHFQPSYCPDENRIERVWQDLHANVTRNHQCSTIDELMKEVRYWLRKESKRLQKRYAKLDPSELYPIAA